jgi:hypothetical protein
MVGEAATHALGLCKSKSEPMPDSIPFARAKLRIERGQSAHQGCGAVGPLLPRFQHDFCSIDENQPMKKVKSASVPSMKMVLNLQDFILMRLFNLIR